MSDDKDDAFHDAFHMTDCDGYESVLINRARHACDYLEELVNQNDEIAAFTVAEIIENLNRHL
ncbi:hypothetical protein ABHV46_10970 [Asaia sp. BMEF1]|uniref:hypothetical protein n=1 Tax=Asaia sp. BMEF1 TaxID=3155932 RepID=UPI003F67388D